MAKVTMISESVDSINQQVLNRAMLDPTRSKVRLMVTKSNRKLIPPKNLAKRPISFMFQFLGLVNSPSSTLSVEIDSKGPSLIRLVRSICIGSIGRKFSITEIIASVAMFPTFADIVFRMYFVVLLNVVLPSMIPADMMSRLG